MEVTVILEIDKAVSERLYQSNLRSHVSQVGIDKDQWHATVIV